MALALGPPLVEPAQQQRVPPGAGAQDEEPWREPLVRWCLAALLHRYCGGGEAAGAAGGQQEGAPAAAAATAAAAAASGAAGQSGGWQVMEAKALAQHFAAVSYGDPLFGAGVAMLLRHGVRLEVQVCMCSRSGAGRTACCGGWGGALHVQQAEGLHINGRMLPCAAWRGLGRCSASAA